MEAAPFHFARCLIALPVDNDAFSVDTHTRDTSPVALARQLYTPFIVVSSRNDTLIQCEMAENREDVFFNFR